MKQKSIKAKVAEVVLGTMQVVAIMLGFFHYLQLMADLVTKAGIKDGDAGAVVWGITVGLMVLAGWALIEKDKA